MCRFVKCIMRIIKNRLLQRSLNKADTDTLVSMVKQLALSFVDAECLHNFPYPKNEEETNFLCFAISMMKSVEDQDFLKRISAERKKTILKDALSMEKEAEKAVRKYGEIKDFGQPAFALRKKAGAIRSRAENLRPLMKEYFLAEQLGYKLFSDDELPEKRSEEFSNWWIHFLAICYFR